VVGAVGAPAHRRAAPGHRARASPCRVRSSRPRPSPPWRARDDRETGRRPPQVPRGREPRTGRPSRRLASGASSRDRTAMCTFCAHRDRTLSTRCASASPSVQVRTVTAFLGSPQSVRARRPAAQGLRAPPIAWATSRRGSRNPPAARASQHPRACGFISTSRSSAT
jgi:hypothetical protein